MPTIARQRQTTRLETFVDAAFAFAITMLVISADSIPGSIAELLDALKGVPAFAASFAITVMFWHGHYRWSRRYGLEDGTSVVLSLLLVFLMLVFLYPLRLMMSGVLLALNARVLRLDVAPPLNGVERVTARIEIEAWGILAAMGASSALLALLLPPRFVGLSVWIYVSLAVIMPLMSRRWHGAGAAAESLERSHTT